MSYRDRLACVAVAALAVAVLGGGGRSGAGTANPVVRFAGAEQRAQVDGVQADLSVQRAPTAGQGGASGASVILTDADRDRFAQVGWVQTSGRAPRSFAAWSVPGGVAVRTLPRADSGDLVVYKAAIRGELLRFWVGGVDGPPTLASITTQLVPAEAQIEAEAVGAARLGVDADAPGVLGWAFTHVQGRWSRFAPASVSADQGLATRRVGTLYGESGTHILVWDRSGAVLPEPVVPATHFGVISPAELHGVFGVELRDPAGSAGTSEAHARDVAIEATGAARALSVRLATCIDRQLVPEWRAACYVVGLVPGTAARPVLGARGGPSRRPLRSLTAIVDASSGRLIETLAA